MRFDVVIPAHNEQHRIGATLTAYRAALGGDHDVRFLVALDDCTDDTEHVVAEHTSADTRVTALRYPRLGKGGVLLETFRRSDADYVAFVDADAATPPGELLRLVDVAQQADGAIASRWHASSVLPSRRPLTRQLASLGFAKTVKWLFRLPYRDTQCGAKVLSRELAERVVPLLSSRDFLFDVDLLVTARELGFSVLEVPTIWIDRDGSRLNVVQDARRMAASLARLWLHHRTLPVRLPQAPAVPPPRAVPFDPYPSPDRSPTQHSPEQERRDVTA